MKFVGYTLKDDFETLAGMPQPIHEGVKILRQHIYKSLAEKQIEVRNITTPNQRVCKDSYTFLESF